MIDKTKMKPGDKHAIVSAIYNTMTCYDHTGKKLWSVPAFPVGQHRNWRETGGDTPPGSYKAGITYTQIRGRDSRAVCDAYGRKCIDLIDLEGQETGNNRGGISIHGGGTGLPDPWAPYQMLLPTLGCIRTHNHDLEVTIVPEVEATQKAGHTFFVSVVDRK